MQIGDLEEIIDDDHAIVSVNGSDYYVPIMSFVDKDMLEPGCSVLLNNHSHAIIGVLADDTEQSVNIMKMDKAPTESYADIGGLEQQIQEIKVSAPSLSLSYNHSHPILTHFLSYPSSCPPTGIRRTPPNPSRTLRRNGYPTTQRSHPLRSSRNR